MFHEGPLVGPSNHSSDHYFVAGLTQAFGRKDGSMTGLEILFAARDGRAISAKETTLVDLELSTVDSSEIPDNQVENVRDYISSELLFNQQTIPAEHRAALEKLFQELEGRG
ncbi:hypothetical protein [Agrilutibacter solisilvae]|uniref:Uncharacterized protein n=1 Tax=Agrilutibacter solisilvae TaxID=2763317 RepID=A0A974Y4I2_9GAMM|nr:hypothetical protein [Lysobacter solisilvae]QSX77806.1 hypothetical protein I8J32_013895 [Lysobacter solisilvae]